MTEKQFERMAAKCEKEEKKAKLKIKKAMEQKNTEVARVYAETAIRKKSEGLNHLRMAGRINGVASRIESTVAMKGVTKSMGSVVKGMERAMASMNMEEMMQVMDKFESLSDEAAMREETAQSVMHSATGAPEEAVDDYLKQVLEEEHMETEARLLDARAGTEAVEVPGAASGVSALAASEEDDLGRRLAALRG